MKILIFCLSLVFASTTLIAEQDLIAKLDFDNDGRLSFDETAEEVLLTKMFDELDINEDGYLSPNEL